jgi:hypothetical protein
MAYQQLLDVLLKPNPRRVVVFLKKKKKKKLWMPTGPTPTQKSGCGRHVYQSEAYPHASFSSRPRLLFAPRLTVPGPLSLNGP